MESPERQRERAGAQRRWAWWVVRAFPIHPREAPRRRPAALSWLLRGPRRAPLPPPSALRRPGLPLLPSSRLRFESEPEISLLAGAAGSG